MNSDESGRSGGVYASLGTRQEGGRFEDIGLSLCALPLRILVLGFWRTEFRRSAEGLSELVSLTNSDESGRSGGVYASLGTRQEGGRFEDIGLSLYASPLWILVLGFQRTEFWWSAVGPKVSRGIRETEETEEFTGSIQCDIWTEELPPQHAQYLYYTAET